MMAGFIGHRAWRPPNFNSELDFSVLVLTMGDICCQEIWSLLIKAYKIEGLIEGL